MMRYHATAAGNVPFTEEEEITRDAEETANVAAEQQALAAQAEAEVKAKLREIDISSIRSIREYIATKPDAPEYLKTYEAQAVAEREKLIG